MIPTKRYIPSEMRFPVGTTFVPRSHKAECVYTVVDLWETFNRQGDTVRIEYVCEHSLAGQKIESRECETTVAMGIENMKQMLAGNRRRK